MNSDIIEEAGEELAIVDEEPMALEEFVDYCQENPTSVAHSARYILEAIESCGTRTVVERGEEMERYVFFDDPYGNGEHAILGNTVELNEFVDDLRRMVSEEGENEKIIWFEGPTASGKSELKRCLINGLKGYSREDEGARYTLEWSINSLSSGSRRGLSYNTGEAVDGDWYKSPVNVNPLSVLPEETRERLLEEINEDEEYEIDIQSDIDPFSREAFDYLKDHYKSDSSDTFSQIVSSGHLRVARYPVDVGDGIGVLHSEDDGQPKERLVGNWMQGAMEKFASRGRKNPQAFSYDGVLCQGNGLMTIVEDAAHHADLLRKLLNIPEEKMVKLDKKISMDIDTVLVAISNPDLEAELRQYEQKGQYDPFKSLRRRMNKYEFGYLTSFSLESQLLRRLVNGESEVWEVSGTDAIDKAAEPIEVHGCEFPPHTIEGVAMYEVVTRLQDKGLPTLDKALAFDCGYVVSQDDIDKRFNKPVSRTSVDDIDLDTSEDGEMGIPVTFTKDVLSRLAQENDILMPYEAINEVKEELSEAPLFNSDEALSFGKDAVKAMDYVVDRIESDVLEAMIGDEMPDEDELVEYIEELMVWNDDEVDNDSEDADFDPYRLREFEVNYLGFDEDEYGDGAIPKRDVKKFREENLFPPIARFTREKGSMIEASDVEEIDVLNQILEDVSWDAVFRYYPNFYPSQWKKPSSDTETEEVKEKTIKNMVEQGYSEESATRAVAKIIENSSDAVNPEVE